VSSGSPKEPSSEKPFGEVTLKRIAEFFQNVLSIERSVRNLRKDNDDLRRRVDELQRQVDDHNGQLKVILSTLTSTMSDRLETAANKLPCVLSFDSSNRRS
jgi:CII-binding regulator of phage lambda lysogenization HflD